MLKKLLVAAVVVGAATPTNAHAQMVGAFINDGVEAQADWIAGRSNGDVIFRFVEVGQYSNPLTITDTLVEVGEVRCSSIDRRESFEYMCRVRGRFFSIRAREFEFDSLAR